MASLRILIGALLFTFYTAASFAAEENYAAANIPANLLQNANAVYRNYHMQMSIASAHEIYITWTYAVTILNEQGKNYATAMRHADRFQKVEHMEGRLYDANGELIQKFKSRDKKTYGNLATSEVDEMYFKVAEFDHNTYPYTCEFEIKVKRYYSLSLPEWEPQPSWDCAVEQADLEVDYSRDFTLRYKTFHLPAPPVLTNGDRQQLTASLSAIPAMHKPDAYAPHHDHRYPCIIFNAEKFELDDAKGSFASWQDFGRFVYQLNANRDALPPAVRKDVHQLTDTCTTPGSKIAILYAYLKKNTRYMAIDLGIGGWQTLEATFVAEKGFGDCKALSNYMRALLKEAGITAYQALVYAGDNAGKMLLDFPCSQFNHVILCVPQPHDTVWVECTSKDLPPGYLSGFTANRYVLLLKPDGGYPVKTPANTIEDNQVSRSADITISDKDEMTATIALTYKGHFWEQERHMVVGAARSDIDNYQGHKFKFSSYSVKDCKIDNDLSAAIPVLHESLGITGDAGITHTGQNTFVSVAVFSNSMHTPDDYGPRKEPFDLSRSYQRYDTIIIHLPASYTLTTPENTTQQYPFATYHYTTALISSNTLKVTIAYTQKAGIYPPEQYADYLKLYKQVNTNITSRVVLTRKD